MTDNLQGIVHCATWWDLFNEQIRLGTANHEAGFAIAALTNYTNAKYWYEKLFDLVVDPADEDERDAFSAVLVRAKHAATIKVVRLCSLLEQGGKR